MATPSLQHDKQIGNISFGLLPPTLTTLTRPAPDSCEHDTCEGTLGGGFKVVKSRVVLQIQDHVRVNVFDRKSNTVHNRDPSCT